MDKNEENRIKIITVIKLIKLGTLACAFTMEALVWRKPRLPITNTHTKMSKIPIKLDI
jgi:hypothetical protein